MKAGGGGVLLHFTKCQFPIGNRGSIHSWALGEQAQLNKNKEKWRKEGGGVQALTEPLRGLNDCYFPTTCPDWPQRRKRNDESRSFVEKKD
ncbi:hypothetical protein AX774_g5962 [Zancudomyces culisetae]|uniref:Uncharacterized protein n=1 Tax=Zancudomyces culisetae TaxID=1213189 RepID=A0A1R1PI67_ZANCU|nr:hypothetical protein AX774_g5962 [Zancudomyces culisetae]|eukprot:OMH80603.1 hypothetical protein AX774_g5962 [Zancudomyces culisetae]